ncbi:MAG TPA: hypothetical protein VFU11_00365 [Solirubrobacterales bacterium]|nr:hypothetical protein [Solirubrobacterales bacterium]
MFKAARKHLRAIGLIGVASALVVGGVAAAQGDSSGSDQTQGKRPPGPPPMMALGMKGLTYAELHVQNKDGESETIRIDQGKVKSTASDSITITENDGSEVTIPVDDETEVLGKPGKKTSLDDLEAGQQVNVSAPAGEPADAIMVMPKKGDVIRAFHGGQMPPLPGAEFHAER